MGGLTLLLSGILTFVAPTVYSNNTDELIPLNNIIPEHYNIKLILRIEENVFFGECDIYIKILNETEQIRMSAEKLAISQAILIKNDGSSNLNKVVGNMYDSKKNILILYFKNKIPPGHYILSLRYSSFFKRSFSQILDFPSSNEKEVIWLSATHFQPIWVQRIFPCWNSSNSIFNISIKHSKEYKTLSNAPIRAIDLHEDDMQCTYFDSTPTMSPYQVSIVLTNFYNVIFTRDIIMWCKKKSVSSLQFAMSVTINITLYLKEEWGRLQQISKVNYIVIPNFIEQKDSLENLGTVTYNERDIIYNEESDETQHKYNVMLLIGYKIVREWFESRANTFWSNSLLSKGFIVFFVTEVIDQSIQYSGMADLFVVQFQHECLNFDDGKIPLEIYNHIKVSAILRMFYDAFIIEAIQKDLHVYSYNKRHHLDNFWEALKIAHNKTHSTTYNMETVIEPWIKQKGYPVLNVLRNYTKNSVNISIDILNISSQDRSIPMTFTTQTNHNFTLPHLWIHSPKKPLFKSYANSYTFNLNHKEDGWIIFNIRQTAYYRVNYDVENWRKIAKYLNYGEFQNIHVLNRAAIIDDAFHFILLDKLDKNVFWNLSRYLHREENYLVWYPMFKAIEFISRTFPLRDVSNLQFVKERLGRLLDACLNNIKYKEESTDKAFTKTLRQETVKWACLLEFSKTNCRKMANNQLKQYLESPTKLSPWWKKWTYCYGLTIADNTTWDQVLNEIRGDNDKILYFLNCPNYLVEINKFILISITKNVNHSKFIPEQSFYPSYIRLDIKPSTITQFGLRHFLFTIANSTKNRAKLNAFLHNFEKIKPSQVKMLTALVILINNIYTIEQLDKVYYYFQNLKPDEINKMENKIRTRFLQLTFQTSLLEKINPTYQSDN
ncbi:glutamyl aminopeptidase-like isoform X1 [Anoplolepis gracilipes]|uniref:glutamyl aminopeptidase-like isoform X1 n=1 Tax=Anoplolepis gracilipes TaxID=354296 RepID=UPI003BA1CC74